MFRWLHALLGSRNSGAADPKWVEPSNAITRAVLGGMPLASLAVASAPEASDDTTLPERPQPAVVTRTAQRVRRRRAGRAA
jgi:hypothetical protein